MNLSDRKRIKLQKESNYEGPDIISTLPDSLICHILSFLPIIYAARTTILSKRWRDVWEFVDDLRFDDRVAYGMRTTKKRLLKSVERVLQWKTSRIQSFSLYLTKKYHVDNVIDQWMPILVKRRVRKLYIESHKQLRICSSCLWKWQSLEELVLKMIICHIEVPTFVCLPSLTILHLSGIRFDGNKQFNTSRELSFKFPVLRKYKLENCNWCVKRVTFEMPLLEVLSIKHREQRVTGSNDSQTTIKFCAFGLKEFSCWGFMSSETILFELSTTHIVSANIDLWNFGKEESLFVSEFLKKFNIKLKCLKFHYPEYPREVLPLIGKSLLNIPNFQFLNRLELKIVSGHVLMLLLVKAPSLRTLVFKELLDFAKPEIVPSCFTSNLEEVNLRRVKGDEYELKFIKYVIEKANGLRRATFNMDWSLRGSNFKKLKDKIFSFKRNPTLKIDISFF